MNYKNMTILIVDDIVENIQIAMSTLKPLGCKFLYAKNGEECLQRVDEKVVDLILLDIMMPLMDGFETCEVLKKKPNTQDIPIIFLSAKDAVEDIIKGFELGAVDYVSKPFQSGELIARVKTHLKLHTLEKDLNSQVKQSVQKVVKLEKEAIEKERIFHRQSKMATMGEMLENIAHQWRQPLSLITASASLIELKKERNELDDAFVDTSVKNIIGSVDYLSQTIMDFREFFKNDHKKKTHFQMVKLIEKTLFLVSSKINDGIIIIKNIEPFEYYGFENQLVQVLINLINNAIDELLKLETKQYLCINIFKDEEHIFIEVYDNAGGIPEDIMEKVFDNYFTTKKGRDGTGIGLFMSKNIIDKIGGTLEVSNTEFEEEKELYKGAKFQIKLPLS